MGYLKALKHHKCWSMISQNCHRFYFILFTLRRSLSLAISSESYMEEDIPMMGDKLLLRGLKFYGYHGAIPEEKTLGQMFKLDIDAWMCLKKAGLSDNLADSISYVDIYNLAKEVVEGSSRNLLEAVAELIASRALESFPRLTAIRVKLWKPSVARIETQIDYLGVEILRTRANV